MPCKGRSSSSSSKECCKTSIDLQAYVLGPYAIVLDKSVCCFASLVKQKNYTLVAELRIYF